MSVLIGMPVLAFSKRESRLSPSGTTESGSAPTCLVDSFGREAKDLRVSITDRCNLRCTYCMPQENPQWMCSDLVLTDAELKRLLRIAVEQLGIEKIRFTGGEPLMRRSLEQLVAYAATLRTDHHRPPYLALTTNGLGLDKRINQLVHSGIRRVNISLDTLDPQRYFRLTGRNRLSDVINSAHAAVNIQGLEVKINTVVLPELLERSEAIELLRWSLENHIQIRFIEHMPLGGAMRWKSDSMVTQGELLDNLRKKFTIELISDPEDPAPAKRWHVVEKNGHLRGVMGIISSVSKPFCQNCDRSRLTADGQVRPCLFSNKETDLRFMLRSGANDEQIAQAWADVTWDKPLAHGINSPDFVPTSRAMFEIGG